MNNISDSINTKTCENLDNNVNLSQKRPLEDTYASSGSARIDTSDKKQKNNHNNTFVVEKTDCRLFVGKNNAFRETIDHALVARLIGSGLLSTERDGGWMDKSYNCSEKTHLIKLRNKLKNDVLTVIYKTPKSGYGRVEPRGCLSLGSLRKEVRHTLCEGQDWKDIDITNAHPEILRQLCSKANIECKALEHYCNNREPCLKDVTKLFIEGFTEDNRDVAKVLYIRLMYGGTAETWLKDMKKEGIIDSSISCEMIPSNVFELQKEVDKISITIQKINPDMVEAIKKVRKKMKKEHNFNGSFLSYYMQEQERRMLECVYNMMVQHQYIRGRDAVLCYDGIMIHEENLMNTSISTVLKQCEAVISSTFGLQLKFTQKKMKKSLLKLIEQKEKEHADMQFPGEYTEELDHGYMNSLPNYETQKRYFELFVCKAMQPDPIYIWTSKIKKKDRFEVISDVYVTNNYDETRLKKSLKHIRNNDKCFLDKWFVDPSIRCFNRVDFEPYNGVFNPQQNDKKVYNLFKGYNPLILSPLKNDSEEYRNKVLAIFMDLTLQLFEGNVRFRDLFLKTRAYKIQYPQKKLGFTFIVTGAQGVGKDLTFGAIGNIVGPEHYYTTVKPNDLFGPYAEGFVHRLFVTLNECEGKDTRDLEGAIKAASTDVEMTVNAKFQRPVQMKNLAQLDITSNKPNPLPIDTKSGDRRFLVARSTRKYLDPKYNSNFWERTAAHFRSPLFSNT